MHSSDHEDHENSRQKNQGRYHLANWGFSVFEKRAIWLLVVLLIIGSSFRLYRNYRLSEQLNTGVEFQVINPAGEESSHDTTESVSNSVIDINLAGIPEFVKLPGIGYKKAEAIIEYRRECGGFRNVAELRAVNGIGPKTYEDIKMFVKVNDTTFTGK